MRMPKFLKWIQTAVVTGLTIGILYVTVPLAQQVFSNDIAWLSTGHLAFSGTTPTLPDTTQAFGSAAFTTTGYNGVSAFRLTVGSLLSWSGTVGMPTASNGWNCYIADLGGAASATGAPGYNPKVTNTLTTAIRVWNFGTGLTTTNWNTGDVLQFKCAAY